MNLNTEFNNYLSQLSNEERNSVEKILAENAQSYFQQACIIEGPCRRTDYDGDYVPALVTGNGRLWIVSMSSGEPHVLCCHNEE
jgi:hypothetical protein